MKLLSLSYYKHDQNSQNRAQYRDLKESEIVQFDFIKNCGLFDEDWYVDNYPDVRRSKVNPIYHYVKYGASEGRNPNNWFDTFEYASKYMAPEIRDRVNPLMHYVQNRMPVSAQNGDTDRSSKTEKLDTKFHKGQLSAFSDFSVRTAVDRFKHFPLFSDVDYMALNEPLRNVAGLIPHQHALTYGISEGRSVFRKDNIANMLGLVSQASVEAEAKRQDVVDLPSDYDDGEGACRKMNATPRSNECIGVFYNSEGNVFLKEIAECVVNDLQEAGYSASLHNENADLTAIPARSIIVAPHEFFFVGKGRELANENFVARSIVLNTEQPQTVWFDRAIPFSLMSRGVIDISPQVAALYRDTGIPTLHIDLSGAIDTQGTPDIGNPLFRVLPPAAKQLSRATATLAERPIDVSFFGAMSTHRERFFTKAAAFLSDYETFLYCRRFTSPIKGIGRDRDLTRLAGHVARHSKITLNIHRDEYGFFEWHRIVRTGMDCGSLVVSEPCLPHPVFKPGVHFFEEAGRHLQNLIEWLLRSEDGMARAESVREAASGVLRRARTRNQSGHRIAAFVDSCFV